MGLTLWIAAWSGAAHADICEAQEGSSCYYASPNGSGSGTFEDPGSIRSTTSQLSAGDIVYLRGGEYTSTYRMDDFDVVLNLDKGFNFRSPAPTSDSPATIKGYPGERAIIRGDFSRVCVVIDGPSHLVVSDLTITDCYNAGILIGVNLTREDIQISNVEVSNIQYQDNSSFIQVSGYSNVVIKDSTFHDYIPRTSDNFVGSYLKFFQATDVVVENNLFYGNGGGIYYKHGERATGRGGYTRIVNNTFRDLTRHSVYTNQNRTEIVGNLMVSAEIIVHQEDGTRLAPFTKNVVIAYNTLVGSGVSLNEGCESGCIDGLSDLGASDATVNNNIFLDSSYRIWNYGSNSQYNKGINLTSHSNCFDPTGTQQIRYFSSSNFGSLGDTYDLAGWQAQGWGQNSIEVDAALDGNYVPASNSPCAQMGRTAFSGFVPKPLPPALD